MTHEKVLRKEWGMQFHPEKLYYKGMLGDLCHDRADAAGSITLCIHYLLKLLTNFRDSSIYPYRTVKVL